MAENKTLVAAGRRALVTGGARGIGLAIARALHAEGASLVVTGRSRPELDAVRAELGAEVHAIDFLDRAALERLASTLGANDGIDILVNNAGVAPSAPLAKTTDEAWDQAFAVNVTAAFVLCRALAAGMVSRGYGRIVNIASNAGRVGYAYTTAYCASKHAIVGLTRALAAELARSPVTVNALCPGFVETQITTSSIHRISEKTGRSEDQARAALEKMSPQGRIFGPEEIAHAVLALLPEAARGIHGQSIVIDGGQVMA